MAEHEEDELDLLNTSGEQHDDSVEAAGRFYSPDIVPTLIEIFAKLPLTSCILNGSFDLPIDQHKYPTSSATEANFRVVLTADKSFIN